MILRSLNFYIRLSKDGLSPTVELLVMARLTHEVNGAEGHLLLNSHPQNCSRRDDRSFLLFIIIKKVLKPFDSSEEFELLSSNGVPTSTRPFQLVPKMVILHHGVETLGMPLSRRR